jgi:cell division ATPase FtsA
MIEETDFEIFLYVSKNSYQIFVFDKKKLENLYSEEMEIYNESNFQDLKDLSKFLDKNIYKIEKLVGNFVKNIILIIENDKNLNVNIGIKKKIYDSSINQRYLENNLIDLKDLFKENYQKQTIMHMVIVNYIINGQKYSSYKKNLISDNLSLEVNFFSISNELVSEFDKILERYQIKISQYMCGNYIKFFFDQDTSEISLMAHKLKNGCNDNEVVLVPKNIENKGFFEKFFQLFS